MVSLYEIYYVMFNALEKCPSVVLKKHGHFRRMIENRVPTVPEKQVDKIVDQKLRQQI